MIVANYKEILTNLEYGERDWGYMKRKSPLLIGTITDRDDCGEYCEYNVPLDYLCLYIL